LRPPESGEFVKWFANTFAEFTTLDFPNLRELGDFSTIEQNNARDGFCRFFNRVTLHENTVEKSVIDTEYENVHDREVAWYAAAEKLGFQRMPRIFQTRPLIMERLKGCHAWQIPHLTEREKRAVLADYLDSLEQLHRLDTAPTDKADIEQVYLVKTLERIRSVAGIIPVFSHETIVVNGRKCKNPFAGNDMEKGRETLLEFLPLLIPEKFTPIHGDATFSNTLIDDCLRVWFIDPRGYFYKPGIMGDPFYDFAKGYYSAVGHYDAFNRRKFKLYIDDETVEILMEPSAFSQTAESLFTERFTREMPRIRLLHALIWLSFSGYVRDDVDSVIGAFCLGLYWLQTAQEAS
jgi:hypothetical protein